MDGCYKRNEVSRKATNIIDTAYILGYVKYSGRVAEGIRGNSGERSSEEFGVLLLP
jgi:hypothetical protein